MKPELQHPDHTAQHPGSRRLRRPSAKAFTSPWALAGLLLGVLLLAPVGPVAWAQADTEPEIEASIDSVPVFTEQLEVQVINVNVTVTDRKGQPIAGLDRDDFELLVDGQPMEISNFYAESSGRLAEMIAPPETRTSDSDSSFVPLEQAQVDAPRTAHIVVLVDHSRLKPSNRKRAFKALREAVDQLGNEDLIAVVGIQQGALTFHSDFLYDRQAVQKILTELESKSATTELNAFERREILGELTRGMSGGIQARASQANEQFLITRIRAYAEEEYNRSRNSMRQIETVVSTLGGLSGRKAVLYVGEGIPTRPGEGLFVEWRNRFGTYGDTGIGLRHLDFNTDYSRAVGRYDLTNEMDKLAKTANRIDVTLYAVDAEGSHGGLMRSALTEQGATSETVSVIDNNFREPLEFATKATGGRLLRSSGLLADQMLNIVGDLDTFYSLGFEAPTGWEPGSDHDVEVRAKGPKLVVRHRQEVRLPIADELEAGATVAALMYQSASNPLDIRASTSEKVDRTDGNAVLRVDIEIPLTGLGFLPQGANQAASLTIYVATKDAKGNPGKVQKIPFHLDIPSSAYAQAVADGAAAQYPLPLVLRPGDQQVAIGIRDNVNRVFSAVRIELGELATF